MANPKAMRFLAPASRHGRALAALFMAWALVLQAIAPATAALMQAASGLPDGFQFEICYGSGQSPGESGQKPSEDSSHNRCCILCPAPALVAPGGNAPAEIALFEPLVRDIHWLAPVQLFAAEEASRHRLARGPPIAG
jgi:hypothetical protein